jgi:hypothetical protein
MTKIEMIRTKISKKYKTDAAAYIRYKNKRHELIKGLGFSHGL